ncbi:MAG: phenylalanine--tRNA ligase subunit alpha [Candidatus Marsarchaeota archaeon]|nr:phenylalanine--tRNA ligase subunit alpha [Candidatus Marsarchaeota archaeon]MCL5412805.1 phenylalanine--tRNA ligase subunit alpha [Candidatus Marsarchaeota archaeon]
MKALVKKPSMSLEELESASGLGRAEAMWALENLKARGLVEVTYSQRDRLTLSGEGREYAEKGLPEERLLRRLAEEEVRAAALNSESEKIGLQWAKRLGLVTIEGGMVRITESGVKAASAGVADGRTLRSISAGSYKPGAGDDVANLVKRGLVESKTQRHIDGIIITDAGRAEDTSGNDEIDAVDRNTITNGTWKERGFKRYDVSVDIERQAPAMRHPVKRLIEKMRDTYISMGFKEISGPAVESSFWVFDALFVPQDHPARDAQDTFYISNLENELFGGLSYVKTVRKAHQKGWNATWSEEVAGQRLLRTHTTSVSARHMYRIIDDIKKNPNKYELPVKLFSIGRVFRNEAVDYRHLADFYQHDGIIIGKDLTLSNLFDTLRRIYRSIGIDIKFKPSYFPFVEPGVEFMSYSDKTKEWIEMGGAGMIREEITGVKRNRLTVLAWGPGMERILLIRDPSISGISELYNNGLGWLRDRRGV